MWCDNKDCCYNMGCGQCDIEYLISFDGEGRCEGICIVEDDDREETKNRLSPKKKLGRSYVTT